MNPIELNLVKREINTLREDDELHELQNLFQCLILANVRFRLSALMVQREL